MRKKRLTPNQKAFYAEVERIQRAVKRYQKKGYVFSSDVIPEKPQRVTKKYLAELKSNPNFEDFLNDIRDHETVTILTSAKDVEHSHIPVLVKFIEKKLN